MEGVASEALQRHFLSAHTQVPMALYEAVCIDARPESSAGSPALHSAGVSVNSTQT